MQKKIVKKYEQNNDEDIDDGQNYNDEDDEDENYDIDDYYPIKQKYQPLFI